MLIDEVKIVPSKKTASDGLDIGGGDLEGAPRPGGPVKLGEDGEVVLLAKVFEGCGGEDFRDDAIGNGKSCTNVEHEADLWEGHDINIEKFPRFPGISPTTDVEFCAAESFCAPFFRAAVAVRLRDAILRPAVEWTQGADVAVIAIEDRFHTRATSSWPRGGARGSSGFHA